MRTILQSIRMYVVLSFILGLVYPLASTLAAQIFFKEKAEGSLIQRDGKTIGSRLIAQKFEDPRYFHPRPSAIDYNPLPSGGSNLGPTAKKLQESVRERSGSVPNEVSKEMLYASASGLDPHLSPAAALEQVTRVAKARQLSGSTTRKLEQLIRERVEERALGFIAEPVVNVLELNLAVDRLANELASEQ